MAKLTYLQLTRRGVGSIATPEIGDVSSATGHAKVIAQIINEAQIELFNEEDWYSLYTTRTFDTVASTAEYALASDFGKSIDLIDTTSGNTLIEDVIRAMNIADPEGDALGNPSHFA